MAWRSCSTPRGTSSARSPWRRNRVAATRSGALRCASRLRYNAGMSKDDVAAALDEIATLLSLKGENDFKIRAYQNASRLIAQLEGDLKTMIADGSLAEVRGIGEA